MNWIKIENSLKKIQRQVQNIQKDGSVSTLDVDYLKKLTVQFYEELNVSEEINEGESKVNQPRVLATPISSEKEIIPESFDNPVEIMDPLENVNKDVPEELDTDNDSNIDELFSIPSGFELSDILSNRPIEHISESMGFNERIFTINELFDGNKEVFEQVVDKLNLMSSFEEARDYLKSQVIKKYGWDNESLFKKAQTFVRHIQRRYQGVTAE